MEARARHISIESDFYYERGEVHADVEFANTGANLEDVKIQSWSGTPGIHGAPFDVGARAYDLTSLWGSMPASEWMMQASTQKYLVALILILHALTPAVALLVGVFYFAPERIVFGVQASVALGLLLGGYNLVGPRLARLFGLRDRYFAFIVRHTGRVLLGSLVFVAVAVWWVAVMFGTIVERYKYLEAVNNAISVIGSNQLALPAPEDLAVAFNLMPQRPEVPFILMRAARLLSFGDGTQNYYVYVQRFIDNVDTKDIASRFKEFHRPVRFRIDGNAPALPLLDPVQVLSNFGIESENPSAKLSWAIDLLRTYRNRDEDAELKLWRTMLEAEQLFLKSGKDAAAIGRARLDAITKITAQTEPQSGDRGFRELSFAADHLYQEALDYLAWLYAGGPEADAGLPVPCEHAARVVPTFQRVLLLRRRLVTRSDLLWWRFPSKLTIHFLYLHLGGEKGTIATRIFENFGKCPGVSDAIKELHSAIAFKQFQDPETWFFGTPLSPSLNGSASIALLRQWIRLGW